MIGSMVCRAVYPGSFDPPTLGHLDIMERASRLFDEVIVSVGVNLAKTPLLTAEQRLECLGEIAKPLSNVRIARFEGLLVEHARSLGAYAVVRGLRATSDFEYEFQMAMVNRRLAPDVETVFFMTKWEHSYLSSSMVREVALLGGDYSEMVPGPVGQVLARAISNRT